MKAIHVTNYGAPDVMQLVEVETPKPKAGEVLVKIHYADIAYVDIMERTDFFRHGTDPMRPVPYIPGTEGSGVVAELGEGVTDWKIGDRVAFVKHQAKAYAEFTTLPADRLIPIPDEIAFDVAAAILAQGMTAHYLIHEFRNLEPGVNVLIHAATGGVGSLLVQWAKRKGATVIATVSSHAKVNVAKELGADHVIVNTEKDFVEEVMHITDNVGAHLILDALGKPTFRKDLDALAIRGVVVPFGIVGGKPEPVDPLELVYRSRTVANGDMFDFVISREDLLRRANDVFQAYREGWLKPNIASIFPLSEAVKAHELMEDKTKAGKILLQVQQ